MTRLEVLERLEHADPDGWEHEPTAADRDRFRRWAAFARCVIVPPTSSYDTIRRALEQYRAEHGIGVRPTTCLHCARIVVLDDGRWVDPEATGDDVVWRETCDEHDTFTAEHEPVLS